MSQTITATKTEIYNCIVNGSLKEFCNLSMEDIKNVRDIYYNNAIQIAYIAGRDVIVDYLIDSNKYIDCDFENGLNKRNESLIHLAMHRNDSVLLQKILRKRIKQAEQIINELKKELAREKSTNERIAYENVTMKKLNDRLQATNDNHQETINTVKQENASLTTNLKRKREECDVLEQQNKSLRANVNTFTQSMRK